MWYHTDTLQGHRPYNEDRTHIVCNINNECKNYKEINYYGLFDGHGGDHVSKYLKQYLGSYFISEFVNYDLKKNSNINKYITKVYDTIQNKLVHYELPSRNTGSTALVSLIYKNNNKPYLKVINLGDCRIIGCASGCTRNNIAMPLSKDHKPKSFEEYNRIIKLNGKIEQEKGDEPRVKGMAVSRSFGDLDATPEVTHKPDIYDYNLLDYKFIVMGCDGLYDVLSNQDIVDFVLNQIEPNNYKDNYTTRSKNNIATKLINFAFKSGSQDNITAIIIFLE